MVDVKDFVARRGGGSPGSILLRSTNIVLRDNSGDAARIEFVYSNPIAGIGHMSVKGRLAADVERVLRNPDAVVYVPQQGFRKNRPDYIFFVLRRLTQAMNNGELPRFKSSSDGWVPLNPRPPYPNRLY